MTFVYENDLDILQMYLHTKNKHSRSRLSEVRALQTDRQTDRHRARCDRQHYHAAFVGGKNQWRGDCQVL